MTEKSSIVLLNPPADEIVIRDNYCSKVSQAFYINHPIDLLIQSGFLNKYFNVHVIDAIVSKMPFETCLKKIAELNPKAVYALAGNASWNSDLHFFKVLKHRFPNIILAVSGDIFLENPEDILKDIQEIDIVITDFTLPTLTDFLNGNDTNLNQVLFRHNAEIVDRRTTYKGSTDFTIPCPLHDRFVKYDYRYPFVKRKPFATVMTEYGCPYHCAFCVMGTLGHKVRPVDNVVEELSYVSDLGIRDVFFVDQSFGNNRNRTAELCKSIYNRFPYLRWICFSRVDLVHEEVLREMKLAGCHTIIFGVETANEIMLDKYRKGYHLEQVKSVFSLMKRLKIRSVATFLLGLPGETWQSACETIEFAKVLNCDFASINVAVPRMGTDLRKWAIEKGYIDPDHKQFDQSGTEVIMETEQLSRDELQKLKRKAVRDLYLRPGYLLRRLLSIRSVSELSIQCHEGFNLFKKLFSYHHDNSKNKQ
ncbi:radical SAM protein [bacterium]|nr:radical SAM protein [candidate division CSSED10-310 bacterium]